MEEFIGIGIRRRGIQGDSLVDINAHSGPTATLPVHEIHLMKTSRQINRHYRVATSAIARITNFRAIDLQTEAVIAITDKPASSTGLERNCAFAADGIVVAVAGPGSSICSIPQGVSPGIVLKIGSKGVIVEMNIACFDSNLIFSGNGRRIIQSRFRSTYIANLRVTPRPDVLSGEFSAPIQNTGEWCAHRAGAGDGLICGCRDGGLDGQKGSGTKRSRLGIAECSHRTRF